MDSHLQAISNSVLELLIIACPDCCLTNIRKNSSCLVVFWYAQGINNPSEKALMPRNGTESNLYHVSGFCGWTKDDCQAFYSLKYLGPLESMSQVGEGPKWATREPPQSRLNKETQGTKMTKNDSKWKFQRNWCCRTWKGSTTLEVQGTCSVWGRRQ